MASPEGVAVAMDGRRDNVDAGAGASERKADEETRKQALTAEAVTAAMLGDGARVRFLVEKQGVGLYAADEETTFQVIHGAVFGRTKNAINTVETLLELEERLHALQATGEAANERRRNLVNEPTLKTLDTPLHIACAMGDVEMVNLLVEKGADKYRENREGLIPFELAVKFRRHEAAAAVQGDTKLGVLAKRRGKRPTTCGQTQGYWTNLFSSTGHCLFFALALGFLCAAVLVQTQRTQEAYFFTHLMEDKLLFEEFESTDTHVKKLFYDIGEVSEFWEWLHGPLCGTLANRQWATERETAFASGFIHGHNRLVGPARLRQLRVRNDSCSFVPEYAEAIGACYAESFSAAVEETRPFGPANASGTGSQWTYSTADELGSGDIMFGRRAITAPTWYPAGGYVEDVWANFDAARAAGATSEPFTSCRSKIAWLREQRWIDLGSQVVFVDLNVYNANVNMWLHVSIMAEFPVTGGTVVSASMEPVRLQVFEGDDGAMLSWLFSLMAVSLAVFAVLGCRVYYREVSTVLKLMDAEKRHAEEAMQAATNETQRERRRRASREAIREASRVLCGMLFCGYRVRTLANNILTVAFAVGLSAVIGLQLKADSLGADLPVDLFNQQFVQLQPIVTVLQLIRHILIAVLIVACWKVMQYLSPAPFDVGLLARVMGKMGSDLLPFLVVLVVYSVGFTFAFKLAFGSHVAQYRDTPRALVTLFRTMFGDSDYMKLVRVNRLLAPVLTILHLLIAGIFFINVLIAMLNFRYETLREGALEDYGRFAYRRYYMHRYTHSPEFAAAEQAARSFGRLPDTFEKTQSQDARS